MNEDATRAGRASDGAPAAADACDQGAAVTGACDRRADPRVCDGPADPGACDAIRAAGDRFPPRKLPAGERPRERLFRLGAAALSDAEILALLIGTNTK